VVEASRTPPAVNQVEFSPFEYRRELLAECERRGIALEAYSPLTHGRDLDDEVVAEVAKRNRRTAAQVLLRWGIQRGIPVIPKSTRRERIVENSRVFDFALSPEDMATLDALDRTAGTGRAVESPWWTSGGRARSVVARVVGRLRG
jgi:2,5-diketo-D-gluconate reductase A